MEQVDVRHAVQFAPEYRAAEDLGVTGLLRLDEGLGEALGQLRAGGDLADQGRQCGAGGRVAQVPDDHLRQGGQVGQQRAVVGRGLQVVPVHGRGEHHLLLGGVAPIDRRLADAGAGGHGVHGQSRIAGLGQQFPGCGGDGLVHPVIAWPSTVPHPLNIRYRQFRN